MGLIRDLAQAGYIEEGRAADIEQSVERSGKRPEEVLLERNILPEKELYEFKSEQLDTPLKEVYAEDIDSQTLNSIPQESAAHYRMAPLAKRGDTLDVGMVYPDDIRAKEALQFLARESNFDYNIFLITPSDFSDILNRYKSLRGEVKQALSELDEGAAEEEGEVSDAGSAPDMERMAEDAPVTKIVSVVLRHAVEGRASDIHIEPTRERTRVRFRVDGVLHSSLFLPSQVHSAAVARVKIMSNLKIDETRVPQDGRFSATISGKNIDFRVSVFPTTLGEKAVLRVLDPSMGKRTFGELGIVGRNAQALEDAAKQPFGSILATGPTGSGKTTTLYAVLNLLNKEGVNIVTIEDPVEYHVEGINQSKVRPDIEYTFSSALRSILRQDPDIIMVGEIRDEETAGLATHAALTGHLLLSTLHTNNAVGAVPRLIDMGIDEFLIPATLNAVVAQRLVRRICQSCKEQIRPSTEVEDMILDNLEAIPPAAKEDITIPSPLYLYESEGCRECNFKGYSGRVGVFEVLRMTDELAQLVRQNPSEQDIHEEAQRQGMVTMRQDGILKALQGETSLEEVLRVTGETTI